jgi:chemotaxis protein histidine kinase CheA
MGSRGEKLRSIARLGILLAAASAPACALAQSSGDSQAPSLPSFLDDRRLRELEAARRAAEDASKQKQDTETKRKADDDRRLAAEAEAKRKAEEIRRALAGEAAGKQKEAAEAEARAKAAEEEKRQAEAEARRKVEEEKRQAEAEARRKAEDEKRQAEAEARRKAEDEKRQAEAEARRKAEEEKRQAEAEARRKAEDDKRQAEAETRRRAEEEKRQAAEAETRRTAEEEQRRREAEARRRPEPGAPAQPTARAAMTATPPKINPAEMPCPPAKVASSPLPAGRAGVTIESECRAGQGFSFSYGSLSLPAEFDGTGRYNAPFDLFLGKDAPLEAVFADKTRARVPAQGLDFERISKIAIVWRAPVNLDLHALEYTARHGGAGHVWASAASSAEAALEQSRKTGRGRGFMSAVADETAEDDKAEVYTFWHAEGQESGAISLMVDYETRGDVPRADACGSGPLATVEFRVFRLARGAPSPASEQRALAPAPCGKPLPAGARFNPDSMPHLLIRR